VSRALAIRLQQDVPIKIAQPLELPVGYSFLSLKMVLPILVLSFLLVTLVVYDFICLY